MSSEVRRLWGTVAAVSLIGCIVAWQFVAPAPPDRIVVALGAPQGSYLRYGQELVDQIGNAELEIELRQTAGSEENVSLLKAGEVDLAFVQGGILADGAADGLVALGSLFYEPLWIFHRADVTIRSLPDLAGLRVAVGEPGSGTRPVALALCLANGVGPDDAEWLEASAAESVSQLLAGTVDALFLVTSARSQSVRRLMLAQAHGIVLFDVERHLAYERTFRALRHVVLARGQLDLANDIPAHDVNLLAPVASLVAREDLHPALIPLLIESAQVVFGNGGVFAEPGEFPSPHYLDAPLSDHARRVYESGPSFLYEWFPFRMAAALSRLKIMLLPLLTLLFPLIKVGPPLYRWRIRSKIYRWYRLLRELERRADVAEDEEQRAAVAGDIATVEKEIAEVNVPPSYMDEFYNLRMHVDRMRHQLDRQARRVADSVSDRGPDERPA
jgi:TRAP transporter TAXI family solute receptor